MSGVLIVRTLPRYVQWWHGAFYYYRWNPETQKPKWTWLGKTFDDMLRALAIRDGHTESTYRRVEKALGYSKYKAKQWGYYPCETPILNIPPPFNCGICHQSDRPGNRLCLDHDHTVQCDNFRGWLCRKCNYAVGLLDDDHSRIKRAATWIHQGPARNR